MLPVLTLHLTLEGLAVLHHVHPHQVSNLHRLNNTLVLKDESGAMTHKSCKQES